MVDTSSITKQLYFLKDSTGHGLFMVYVCPLVVHWTKWSPDLLLEFCIRMYQDFNAEGGGFLGATFKLRGGPQKRQYEAWNNKPTRCLLNFGTKQKQNHQPIFD